MGRHQLTRGFCYLISFLLSFPGVALVGAASIFAVLRRRMTPELMPLIAVALMYSFLPALLGGDFMTMGRFFVPLCPILSFLMVLAIFPAAGASSRLSSMARIALALAVIASNLLSAFDLHVTPKKWREAFRFRWNRREYLTEKQQWALMKRYTDLRTLCGRTLAQIANPGQSMVVGAIGAVGYYSNLHVYDLYGLVDREVAHRKGSEKKRSAGHDKEVSPSYFLKYRPDFIVPRVVEKKLRNKVQMKYAKLKRSLPGDWAGGYEVFVKPLVKKLNGKEMILVALKYIGNRKPEPLSDPRGTGQGAE